MNNKPPTAYTLRHHAAAADASSQNPNLEVGMAVVVAETPDEAERDFGARYPGRVVLYTGWTVWETGDVDWQ